MWCCLLLAKNSNDAGVEWGMVADWMLLSVSAWSDRGQWTWPNDAIVDSSNAELQKTDKLEKTDNRVCWTCMCMQNWEPAHSRCTGSDLVRINSELIT